MQYIQLPLRQMHVQRLESVYFNPAFQQAQELANGMLSKHVKVLEPILAQAATTQAAEEK
jgi:hypothetical protein